MHTTNDSGSCNFTRQRIQYVLTAIFLSYGISSIAIDIDAILNNREYDMIINQCCIVFIIAIMSAFRDKKQIDPHSYRFYYMLSTIIIVFLSLSSVIINQIKSNIDTYSTFKTIITFVFLGSFALYIWFVVQSDGYPDGSDLIKSDMQKVNSKAKTTRKSLKLAENMEQSDV